MTACNKDENPIGPPPAPTTLDADYGCVEFNDSRLPVLVESGVDRRVLLSSSFLTLSLDGSFVLTFLFEIRYSSGLIDFSVLTIEDNYSISGATVQLMDERERFATGTLNADRSTIRLQIEGSELTYIVND
jgi:hypothetical protein